MKSMKFSCTQCGHKSPQWEGCCPSCKNWNSLEEICDVRVKKSGEIPQKLSEIDLQCLARMGTGISEIDKVFGGGITIGSLNLICGQPGIGKSTLLLMIANKLSKDLVVLYVSGEESSSQVAMRCSRMGVYSSNLLIFNETIWENIKQQLIEIKPDILILDSIQTTFSSELNSVAGSPNQLKEISYELMNICKKSKLTSIVVGHITKDGAIAGPKLLEHIVDTSLFFETYRESLRRLSAKKNRFGDTGQSGLFEMNSEGLVPQNFDEIRLLSTTSSESFGQSITCLIEGNTVQFSEVQALVAENKFSNFVRNSQGIDLGRINLLLAIMDKYLEIPLSSNDIYINVTQGIKHRSRDGDLSVIASLLSSYKKKKIGFDCIFIGEIGLTGHIQPATLLETRLKESEQLGFKKIYLDKNNALTMSHKFDLNLIGIENVRDLHNYI